MTGAICRAVRLDGGFGDIVLITGPFLGHNNNVEDQTSSGWRYPRTLSGPARPSMDGRISALQPAAIP